MAIPRALGLASIGALLSVDAPAGEVCDVNEDLSAEVAYLQAYAPNIEFPAAGALFERSSDSVFPKGSGALIASTVFMTCRHCVAGFHDVPEKLSVFLAGAGNFKVRRVWDYCRDECDGNGGPEACDHTDVHDPNVHDLALVELTRPATVWPPFALTADDPGEHTRGAHDGRRAAFGGRCGGWPRAVKAVHDVHLEDCDAFDDLDTMVCQPAPNLPISGDSGGPLLHEASAGSWVHTGITKGVNAPGGQTAPWGRYVRASHPQYQDWVSCQLDQAAQRAAEHDQETPLEIKWWGRVEQGYPTQPAATSDAVKVIAPPEQFGSWELPAVPNMDQPDGIDIPGGKDITQLRVTLNHERTTPSMRSVRLALRLHPPASSALPVVLCEGHTFVQCDVDDPAPGVWRIEVTSARGWASGFYQLVALPLGPAGSGSSANRTNPGSPNKPGRGAMGASWNSGPVIRLNTEADGSPSAPIMRRFNQDRRTAIAALEALLREERDWGGPEPPR
jgi:hypothetical protein